MILYILLAIALALSLVQIGVYWHTARLTRRRVNSIARLLDSYVENVDFATSAMKEQIMADVTKIITPIGKDVSDLKAGSVADFEEAKKAAEAVNDFNRGIAALLNYDPMEALHKDDKRRETK